MKKVFIILGLTLLSVSLFAQKNNPYNQRGVDYVASLDIIQNDYNAGRAREFNEETLNYYSKLIPLENQVSVGLVSTIVRTRNSTNFDVGSFIRSTSLSDLSKQAFTNVILNPERLTNDEYKAGIATKVDEIRNSDISDTEKELVLSLFAISYNIPGSSVTAGRGGSAGCWISGPYGEGPGTLEQCIAAGAMIGGLFGMSLCHVPCAIGGAIVGGILGALS